MAAEKVEPVRMGSGLMTFDTVPGWGLGEDGKSVIGPTHGGVVIDKAGNIYTSANVGVFVFSPAGKVVRKFLGKDYTNIHDLEIRQEGKDEFIFAARNSAREGIKFQTNTFLPATYNGGQIAGDEFTCEDAKASMEYYVWPPEWEVRVTGGKADFPHLESVTCPAGPLGYDLDMTFSYALGRTMDTFSRRMAHVTDKDVIEWLKTEREGQQIGITPEGFSALTGTGPFLPTKLNVGVSVELSANPTYWREGLPMVDVWKGFVIKDQATRLTALITGKIDYFGEGSYSLTAGQAEQVLRDFPDKVHVWTQFGCCGRILRFGTTRAPFDNFKARQAVHLAMDREEWAAFRRVTVGDLVIEGTKLAYLLTPGGYFSVPDEELRTWPGLRQPKDDDIAEAKRLLDVPVLCGWDLMSHLAYEMGSDGVISGSATLLPRDEVRLYELARDGRWDEARDLYYTRLLPLLNYCTFDPHAYSVCKYVLYWQGLIATPSVRPPNPDAGEMRRNEVLEVLRRIGMEVAVGAS